MRTRIKIECIIMKIVACIGLLIGFAFMPFQYYMYDIIPGITPYIVLSILSLVIILYMLKSLIDTNHPDSKYNIFTFNPNWTPTIE